MANEDKTVTEALRFIHETSPRLIQTVDVARAVSSSRRNLDEKFCKILGRSVFSEIRRARTDNICHFLIETDMTVSDISRMLGYNDPNHIARYFKKEKGMTPKLFRKTYGLKKTYYKTR
jgi:LacI family transcriptional regulator